MCSCVGICSEVHISYTLFLYLPFYLSFHLSTHKNLKTVGYIFYFAMYRKVLLKFVAIFQFVLNADTVNNCILWCSDFITLCHNLLCSSYQTAWCLCPQDSKMKLHLQRNLKYWIKWQDTLYADMHICISASESNVTCLNSQGENVWDLLNIHFKWPWKHSIEHTEYFDILIFLRLIYNWCGNILVIYVLICLLIAIDDLRHNLH